MTEWLPLREAAVAAHPGRRFGLAQDHAAFQRRVRCWRNAFEPQPAKDWAMYFEDILEFAAALYGAWHAGKRVYLCADNLLLTLQRVSAHVGGFAGDVPAAYAPLAAALAEGPEERLSALDEDETQLFVFTSGSTGEPVAIGKRLRQLAREVEALEAAFGAQVDSVVVHGTVSHQHIYGLLFRVLWPLAAGRATAPRTFFPEDLLASLTHQPSLLVASPAHLKRLPEHLRWADAHGSLRAVFSSGGALPGDAALSVRAHLAVAPTEIYGSSETGGIAWRRWDDDLPLWRALPGVNWRVAGSQLEVSSPHLPDMAWWRTEDRVEADGEGFRLLGRADRIVKIEERRVSLDALERQLAGHGAVEDVRICLPGDARNALAAVVVPSVEGRDVLQREGRRALSRMLSLHLADSQDAVTRPRRWRFVEELPANAQGKVTESALAALFRPRRPEPVWQRREALNAELELELDPALVVFDGHFPQTPILPGVAQLDWAIRFARDAFGLPPRFLRVDALKFQRVARPGDRLRLSLEWQPEKSTLAFHYRSAHGPHASGRVVFAEEAQP